MWSRWISAKRAAKASCDHRAGNSVSKSSSQRVNELASLFRCGVSSISVRCQVCQGGQGYLGLGLMQLDLVLHLFPHWIGMWFSAEMLSWGLHTQRISPLCCFRFLGHLSGYSRSDRTFESHTSQHVGVFHTASPPPHLMSLFQLCPRTSSLFHIIYL